MRIPGPDELTLTPDEVDATIAKMIRLGFLKKIGPDRYRLTTKGRKAAEDAKKRTDN